MRSRKDWTVESPQHSVPIAIGTMRGLGTKSLYAAQIICIHYLTIQELWHTYFTAYINSFTALTAFGTDGKYSATKVGA